MTISDYQRERVNDVQSWYNDVYRTLDDHTPESIRYMVLWAVFNALYNIADYPKVHLTSVSVDDEKIMPHFHGSHPEDKKFCFIATRLAQDAQFVALIIQNHKDYIAYLSQRTLDVRQPPGITSIQFEHKGKRYSLNLSELHGIASLDNRMVRENGAVLFQYHHLDLDLNNDNLPKDQQKLLRQLVFMLYQLRNNIIHGGSASFDLQKKDISTGALSLLDAIVQHLLNHPKLLEKMEHKHGNLQTNPGLGLAALWDRPQNLLDCACEAYVRPVYVQSAQPAERGYDYLWKIKWIKQLRIYLSS